MNNNNTINNKMSADENKVAIVTGSSIGIDYETSSRLENTSNSITAISAQGGSTPFVFN
jgi:NADP-dependent 3-hydroxy acid dehydrogenase YdfG